MMPRPAGDYRDYIPAPVMVMSHDCEWSKVERFGTDYPLLIAPLRPLSAFADDPPGFHGHARRGRVRYLFPLPIESPITEEYVVDLRLIQPITVATLLGLELVSSVGDGIKEPLQGALLVFFTDRKPRKASGEQTE
jgi:hypothetical protein